MTEVVRKDYGAFAAILPNDITCWHYPKKSTIMPQEAVHLAILTARQRDGGLDDIYVLAELEKAALAAPEKHQQAIKRRLAQLKKKLGEH